MSIRKQRAYVVALRMARVKELCAQVALAEAVDQEVAAQQRVDEVEAARQKVTDANNARMANGQQIDLARYEFLTRLDAALSHRLTLANKVLEQASQQRAEKASENVLAKRRRERVGEHLDDIRLALANEHAAKAQQDGIEIWLESREEGT